MAENMTFFSRVYDIITNFAMNVIHRDGMQFPKQAGKAYFKQLLT